MTVKRFDLRFYAGLVGIAVAAYLVHEGAHWLMGEALGYPMRFGLNRVSSTIPTTSFHAMLISAAGPAITIVQGVVGFAMVRARESLIGFALLMSAAFMRAVATGISAFMPNDEARVGIELGLGPWTVHIVVTGLLVALTWVAARQLRVGWREALLCYLVLSIITTAVVGADMVMGD